MASKAFVESKKTATDAIDLFSAILIVDVRLLTD